jgi:DNA-binding transcriptional regulator GbsR (MarR family)
MTDEKGSPEPDRDHAEKVGRAFESFSQQHSDKLDREARESIEKLRRAASEKDADTMRRHLTDVRERHSWLYRELAQHPEIATLLDELALLGL